MSSEFLVQEMYKSIVSSDAFLVYSHDALARRFAELGRDEDEGLVERLDHPRTPCEKLLQKASLTGYRAAVL